MNVPPFLLTAAVAGISTAALAGPIGSLILWRRLSFLGDSLAHASLLGVAAASLGHLPPLWGMLLMTLFVSFVLALSSPLHGSSKDSWLAMIAHATLAVGIIVNSLVGGGASLMTLLFGDILAIHQHDCLLLMAGCTVIGILLHRLWPQLVLLSVHKELAYVQGIAVTRLEHTAMALFAGAIALASYVTGVVLVTALLVIPAMTARVHARSPEAMALHAAGYGILSVLGGLGLSWFCDLPTAPCIVVAAVTELILAYAVRATAKKR